MSRDVFDVAIVGAGIVGAACAAECATAGLRVVVLEAGGAGGGATAAGMGQVVVMDDSEEQFALTRYSRQLWDALEAELPPEVEFARPGTLWVAADEPEMAEVRRKQRFYSERGVAVAVLDPRQLAEAEPHLRPGLAGGLHVPGDSVIYAPCAARWLLARARDRGAMVRERTPVRELEGQRVHLLDGGIVAAARTVNATGTAAPTLTPGWQVRPRKGHLVITARYPVFVRHQVVELGYLKSAHQAEGDSVAFNVQPRPNGQLLIGSSRQNGCNDPAVDLRMVTWMLRRAHEYMPALAALSAVRVWTGFRAATPDKLPLIGPCPDGSGVWLATGHEGLGITTALATAKLLVDQMLGRTPAIPWEPYRPDRRQRQGVFSG